MAYFLEHDLYSGHSGHIDKRFNCPKVPWKYPTDVYQRFCKKYYDQNPEGLQYNKNMQ